MPEANLIPGAAANRTTDAYPSAKKTYFPLTKQHHGYNKQDSRCGAPEPRRWLKGRWIRSGMYVESS